MDKWSVNWQGLIVWDEEGYDDELYFKDEMGRMTNLKVVVSNGDTYTIGTKHDPDNAGGWGDYGLEQPDASVHSHPGIGISEKAELNSMGYRIEKGQKKASGDWKNVVVDFKTNKNELCIFLEFFAFVSC